MKKTRSDKLNSQEILKNLKIFCDKLGRKPTYKEMEDNVTLPSTKCYERHFGSLNEAIKLVRPNLAIKGHRYSDTLVINEIKRLYKQFRKVPTKEVFREHSIAGGIDFRKRKYQWNEYVKLAGLVPIHQYYTDKELVIILKDLKEKLGRRPNISDLNKFEDIPCLTPFITQFGNWNKALGVAGITGNPIINRKKGYKINRNPEITKEYIKKSYLRIKSDLGRVPSRKEFKNLSGITHHMVYIRVGSYYNLLKEFGDEEHTQKTLTIEDLKLRYKKLKQKLGRAPKRQEMNYTMRIQRRFGKWQDFVKGMGDKPYSRSYTEEELKQIILKFNKRYGRPPSSDEMKRPSSKVFQNKFGTWNDALNECGFETKYPIYIADDGHKCYSRMELYVDNFLFHNNIEHKKDAKYPYHKIYNKNCKKTCDWVLSDGRYIEMFGLMKREVYKQKVKIKEQLCSKLGIELIEVYPSNLTRLNKKIK